MNIDILKQNRAPKDRNNLWLDDNNILRYFDDGKWKPFSSGGSIDIEEQLKNYYTKEEVQINFYQKEEGNDDSLEDIVTEIVSNLDISASYNGGEVEF